MARRRKRVRSNPSAILLVSESKSLGKRTIVMMPDGAVYELRTYGFAAAGKGRDRNVAIHFTEHGPDNQLANAATGAYYPATGDIRWSRNEASREFLTDHEMLLDQMIEWMHDSSLRHGQEYVVEV